MIGQRIAYDAAQIRAAEMINLPIQDPDLARETLILCRVIGAPVTVAGWLSVARYSSLRAEVCDLVWRLPADDAERSELLETARSRASWSTLVGIRDRLRDRLSFDLGDAA